MAGAAGAGAGAAGALDIGHDTPVRRANAISLLDADLHGLLQIKEVNETLQAKLSVAKVRTISRGQQGRREKVLHRCVEPG